MTAFDDLFKSDLGATAEKPIFDCPHCGVGITKSSVMDQAKGKSKRFVHEANDVGDHPISHVEPVRPDTGATGQPTVYPGMYGVNKTKKADEAVDPADASLVTKGPEQVVRMPSQYFQWVDDGEDARVANLMAEGKLGSQAMQIPIDGGTSTTRNVGGPFSMNRKS